MGVPIGVGVGRDGLWCGGQIGEGDLQEGAEEEAFYGIQVE